MADSIREALTQAFAAEEKEVPTPAPEAPAATIPTVIGAAEPTPAPAIGQEPAAKPATPPPTATPPKTEVTDTGTPPAPPAAPAPVAAPASWRAAEKASWDKVPPEARAAIMRRESETQRALSTSADARKLQQSFTQALAPFEPLLQAYGVKDPITAIVPLMQTRAALEVGTPAQKAELLANLVYQFNVDIKQLDDYLVRGPRPQMPVPATPQFDPKSVPELAPLFQIAEQFKAAQAAKVDAAVEEVAALPHFEDLREDMADILDLAAQRGRPLTVKQAYDHALSLAGLAPAPVAASPNVSEAAAIMARSRRAASSVAGAPKGSTGAKPATLRDAITAAIDG